MKAGQPERTDYEYDGGTANLFMLFAPREGWRHTKLTDHRKATDYTHVLKDLSDVHSRVSGRSCWFGTISTPMPKPRFTKPFARRGQTACGPLRMALYAPAWELAEYGGVRTGRSELAMPWRIPDGQMLSREVAAWQGRRNKHQTKPIGAS